MPKKPNAYHHDGCLHKVGLCAVISLPCMLAFQTRSASSRRGVPPRPDEDEGDLRGGAADLRDPLAVAHPHLLPLPFPQHHLPPRPCCRRHLARGLLLYLRLQQGDRLILRTTANNHFLQVYNKKFEPDQNVGQVEKKD